MHLKQDGRVWGCACVRVCACIHACVHDVFAIYDDNILSRLIMIIIKIIILYFIQPDTLMISPQRVYRLVLINLVMNQHELLSQIKISFISLRAVYYKIININTQHIISIYVMATLRIFPTRMFAGLTSNIAFFLGVQNIPVLIHCTKIWIDIICQSGFFLGLILFTLYSMSIGFFSIFGIIPYVAMQD